MCPHAPRLQRQRRLVFKVCNVRKAWLRCSLPVFLLLVCSCGGTSAAPGTAPNVPPAAPPVVAPGDGTLAQIKHIVIMVQENRSFDNYFGKLNDYRAAHGLDASVDGLPPDASNPTYDGSGTISAYHLRTACTENSSPSWNESHAAFNRYNRTSSVGLMDGFVYTGAKFAIDEGLHDTQGMRVMGYYDWNDIPYYYFLATQFATSDRWFSPVPANSPANHFYLFAGTSVGHVYSPKTTFSNKTIFELLEEHGISWRIYETDPGVTFLNYYQPFGGRHQANIAPLGQFLTDVSAGNLPAVALIEAGLETGGDEHPSSNVQKGALQVSTLINGLMSSSSWRDSVFLLTWDEGGGVYDHVPFAEAVNPDGIPVTDLRTTDTCYGRPCADFTRTGSRVPLLVVSPFTKAHYVSHSVADYSAILRFIETRFGLPPLTQRDAAQPDMTEFFDLTNVPNLAPPPPPAQPANAPCYKDHLP